MIDYHIHALAHGDYRADLEWYQEYLLRAQALGLKEIGFSEHDDYWEQVKPDRIRSLQTRFSGMQIRVGLETEFRHIQDPELNNFLLQGNLDYIIGSVHFLGDWNFDHPDYINRFENHEPQEVYAQYYAEIGMMINSRRFDIVGHLDLIKIGGRPPKNGSAPYIEPLLSAIRTANMAVELNSGGLRKPLAEIYPAPEMLERLYASNIPLTLGSDAHHPDQVGWELSWCLQMARKAGYRKLAGFNKRHMQFISI